MEAEKANYPVQRMARLLGVSRSGFYAWRRRRSKVSVRAAVRAELDAKVRQAHADSIGIYGAPRVRAALARNGTGVDRKTVAASMRRQGLEGISPRRFRPAAPIGEARVHSLPDLVARKWDTGTLDAVWISDITYLRTAERMGVSLCCPGCLLTARDRLGDGLNPDHQPGGTRPADGLYPAWRRPGRGGFPRRPGHPIHLDPAQ